MLTVDPEQRATIGECLQHPWINNKVLSLTDSTDGLTGAMGSLDFSKRKLARERTLLSSVNDIKISKVVNVATKANDIPVKVWEKNENGKNGLPSKNKDKQNSPPKEETPTAQRDAKEFMEMGGKGDEALFTNDKGSRYP